MNKKGKEDDGFTLFECLCVLLVVSIMGIMPVLTYSHWQEQRKISQTLYQFERLYEKAQQYAIVTDIQSLIKVDTKEQCISFLYSYQGHYRENRLDMPLNLDVSLITTANENELKLLGGTGRPSALVTFVFIDHMNQEKIRYTVQMTNSKVNKYVEKI